MYLAVPILHLSKIEYDLNPDITTARNFKQQNRFQFFLSFYLWAFSALPVKRLWKQLFCNRKAILPRMNRENADRKQGQNAQAHG